MSAIETFARIVDDAARTATAIAQLTDSRPDLTVADAYAIQAASIQRRLARGERRIGIKMGLTSRAKMQQVGVSEPLWGRLTDAMLAQEGGAISRAAFIHPRAEPEVAFLIKRPLAGDVSLAAALAAVEAVAPAIEIIDSRYRDFKFALPDVVADNSSSSALAVGPWGRPDQDLSNLGMILEINGRAVQIGSSAAILGHPLRSLAMAARMAARAGEKLDSGDIVLAGGATAAHALAVGDHVRVAVQSLGNASVLMTA